VAPTPGGTLQGRLFARDHLGSVRHVTSTTGTWLASIDYDAWGRRTVTAGSTDDTSLAFTGHWWHEASGLALAPYRGYDPIQGRWISRDPIAEKGGIGLYTYSMNEPVTRYDHLGLKSRSVRLPRDPVELNKTRIGQAIADERYVGKLDDLISQSLPGDAIDIFGGPPDYSAHEDWLKRQAEKAKLREGLMPTCPYPEGCICPPGGCHYPGNKFNFCEMFPGSSECLFKPEPNPESKCSKDSVK
jgi:RHS repeat-associated protein